MSDEETPGQIDLRSRGDLSRARKREEKRLFDLAATLVGLSKKQTSKLCLDADLFDVVVEARRMRSHGARARQLRIVRRELRNADSHAIGEAVEDLVNPQRRPSPAMHAAQRWLERFLAEGDAAVEAFVLEHERADRQRLRGLLRNLLRADASRMDKARKALLDAARDVIESGSRA